MTFIVKQYKILIKQQAKQTKKRREPLDLKGEGVMLNSMDIERDKEIRRVVNKIFNCLNGERKDIVDYALFHVKNQLDKHIFVMFRENPAE